MILTFVAHEETINGKTLSVRAEVGLLSRNIKIEGEDYSDLYPESFGGYILVGASSIGTGQYIIHIYSYTFGGRFRFQNAKFL